jgi:hypothetical protein
VTVPWIALGAGAAITLTLGVRFYLTRKSKSVVSSNSRNGDAYAVHQSNIQTGGGDNAGRDIKKTKQG